MSVYGTKQNQIQGSLRGKHSGHILRKTNLGRALFSMVEMYSKNKQSNFDELFTALDLLKVNLQEKKEQETVNFSNDEILHNSEQERLSARFDEYSERVVTYTEDLRLLNTQRQVMEQELLNLQGQLAGSNDQIASEQEYLETLDTNFNANRQSHMEALNLLQQAIDTLQNAQAIGNDAFNSFIQTQQKNINDVSMLLELKMKKFENTKQMFMKPIANIFSQMKAGTRVPNESLLRAEQALTDLRDYLALGLQALTSEYEDQKSRHEDVVTNLKALRDRLESELIPAAQQNLEVNQSNLDDKQVELNDATQNQQYYQDQLQQENQAWTQRVADHESLMPQFDSEYEIVVQAENILRAQP